jgi:hypothetical protein
MSNNSFVLNSVVEIDKAERRLLGEEYLEMRSHGQNVHKLFKTRMAQEKFLAFVMNFSRVILRATDPAQVPLKLRQYISPAGRISLDHAIENLQIDQSKFQINRIQAVVEAFGSISVIITWFDKDRGTYLAMLFSFRISLNKPFLTSVEYRIS